MTSADSIKNYLTENNYDFDRRDRLASQLEFDAYTVRNWYPAPDYTGAYLDTDINALWVEGNKIKKGGNKGVDGADIRLKGVSLASLLYEDSVALVTNIIADTVNYPTLNMIRLPMYDVNWAEKSDANKLIHWDTIVQPCIDLCTAANIYAVVDYHGVNDWGSQTKVDFVKEWADFIVPRVRNNPFVIIEMFNEPVAPVIYPWAINDANKNNWLAWRSLYQQVVDFIRYRHPCKNIIAVGSPRYSTQCVWADEYPFDGEGLIYTFHAYPNFTGGLRSYLGMPLNAASSQTVLENAIPKNVPVFKSELGYATPDASPGDATNLTNDTDYPVAMENFLVENKHVHPSIWAHSIYGLGTENEYGSTMKLWWKNTLPLITT